MCDRPGPLPPASQAAIGSAAWSQASHALSQEQGGGQWWEWRQEHMGLFLPCVGGRW